MATAVETDTITAIELQGQPGPNVISQANRNDALTTLDDVAEASRIVDAGVPEGEYGWVAVTACAVLSFFVGTTYCWGVYQGALVADGLSSASTLAWIGSLTIACIAMFSIFSARLLTTIGSRRTAYCGICFLASGEILSGFTVDNIGGLFITAGLVMGVGVSLLFIIMGSVTTQYFNRKRGLANGIVFAGNGLGGAVMSFVIEGLLQSMGTAWTFRIVGFITLALGLPAAWFIKDRIPPNRTTFIEWPLFKDFRFVILFLAGAVATFPLLVPPFFLPLYANSISLTSSKAAALVSGFNFSSAVGRIGAGLLSDRIGPLNTLAGSLFLNGLSLLALWPVSNTITPLVIFAVVNGAAAGSFFSLMPTVASQVFGSARVSVALGMLVTGWSGGYLMGAPIAGYMIAAYGGQSKGFESYRPAMYYAGSMAFASAGLVIMVRLRISSKLAKKL